MAKNNEITDEINEYTAEYILTPGGYIVENIDVPKTVLIDVSATELIGQVLNYPEVTGDVNYVLCWNPLSGCYWAHVDMLEVPEEALR